MKKSIRVINNLKTIKVIKVTSNVYRRIKIIKKTSISRY